MPLTYPLPSDIVYNLYTLYLAKNRDYTPMLVYAAQLVLSN